MISKGNKIFTILVIGILATSGLVYAEQIDILGLIDAINAVRVAIIDAQINSVSGLGNLTSELVNTRINTATEINELTTAIQNIPHIAGPIGPQGIQGIQGETGVVDSSLVKDYIRFSGGQSLSTGGTYMRDHVGVSGTNMFTALLYSEMMVTNGMLTEIYYEQGRLIMAPLEMVTATIWVNGIPTTSTCTFDATITTNCTWEGSLSINKGDKIAFHLGIVNGTLLNMIYTLGVVIFTPDP